MWVREEATEAAAAAVRACVPEAQVIALVPDAEGVRVESLASDGCRNSSRLPNGSSHVEAR